MKRFLKLLIAILIVMGSCLYLPLLIYLSAPSAPPLTIPAITPIAGQSVPFAVQEEFTVGIILHAQDEAEVGELVRFDATDSDVDGLTWKIIPHTDDFEVIENGRRAFFSAREGGSFLIIIAAAKDKEPFLIHHTLTVLGDEKEPGPEPLSTKVRKWAKKVPKYEKRKDHALALAGVFRKLATADDIKVDNMLEATATANSAVLGEDIDKWIPMLEPLGEELDVLSAAGKLNTREQYKNVWMSIAEGIERSL